MNRHKLVPALVVAALGSSASAPVTAQAPPAQVKPFTLEVEVDVVSVTAVVFDKKGRFIRDLGTNVIIAGGMGPKAIEMFHGFGIDVATGATGAVTTVLGSYLRGEHRGVEPCAHDHRGNCGEPGQRIGGSHG